MNNTNKLISGDNKGYASMLMEQAMNGGNDLPKEVSVLEFHFTSACTHCIMCNSPPPSSPLSRLRDTLWLPLPRAMREMSLPTF